jgi:hypothetical protein
VFAALLEELKEGVGLGERLAGDDGNDLVLDAVLLQQISFPESPGNGSAINSSSGGRSRAARPARRS